MALRRFTRVELEARNSRHDAVVIIDNVVYDVTQFLEDHPGGVEVLLLNAGQDASKCFHEVGHSDVALEWRQTFAIGEVVDEDKWEVIVREHLAPEADDSPTLQGIIDVWGTPLLLAVISIFIYIYLFS